LEEKEGRGYNRPFPPPLPFFPFSWHRSNQIPLEQVDKLRALRVSITFLGSPPFPPPPPPLHSRPINRRRTSPYRRRAPEEAPLLLQPPLPLLPFFFQIAKPLKKATPTAPLSPPFLLLFFFSFFSFPSDCIPLRSGGRRVELAWRSAP